MKTFSEIIESLKILRTLSTDDEVADLLGIKHKTLSSRKRRNSIPYEELIAFCTKEKIPLELLLTGEGPAEKKAEVDFPKDSKLFDILQILKNDLRTRDAVYEFLVSEKHLERATRMLKSVVGEKIEENMLGDFKQDPVLFDIIRILKANPMATSTIYHILQTDLDFTRSLKFIRAYVEDKLTMPPEPS